VPKDASNYFRVGDDYFEYVDIPDPTGRLENNFHKRSPATIRQDHGGDIFKHIPKYKAFCNVPSHTGYSRVISSCFNLYFPFAHEPEDGECQISIDFIKHVFGTEEKSYTNKDGKIITVQNWDLALDYITILFKYPQYILPILCLVSKDRQTGKTTFINWLNKIFTLNMSIVSNQDLSSDFNAHWLSKLLIACDETMIDSQSVMEKIKALSTAKSAFKNGKGTNQEAQYFFGKFILVSNNEDNFVRLDKQEIRFWINKVPPLKKINTELEFDLIEEIPAFLNFLNKRSLATTKMERHWFDSNLLKTDALLAVQKNSVGQLEKSFYNSMKSLFETTNFAEATVPKSAMTEIIISNKKYTEDNVANMLTRLGYKTHPQATIYYPRIREKVEGSGFVKSYDMVKARAAHYIFKAEDFILKIDNETTVGDIMPDNTAPEELPF
jgi:Family of unknown function (DUF5906)